MLTSRPQYEILEEAGTLRFEVVDAHPDLYDIAIVHMHLQQMFETIAQALLARAGFVALESESGRSSRRRRRKAPKTLGQLTPHRSFTVRAGLYRISSGSLFEDIFLQVPAILANGDVRAILQGVLGNAVYSFLASSNLEQSTHTLQDIPRSHGEFVTPEVGSNVRAIVQTIAKSGGGRLRLSHVGRNGERTSLEVDIDREA